MVTRKSYAQWADDLATMPIEEARKILAQMTKDSGYYHAPKKMKFCKKDSEEVEILSMDEMVSLDKKFNEQKGTTND